MRVLNKLAGVAAVVLAAALAPTNAQSVAALPCESCNHELKQCDGPTAPNQVCLRGENPDGSPFCTTENGWECGVQTSAIDVGVTGSPLMRVPGSLLAEAAVDVRRSCDGVVLRHVLTDIEAAQVRETTGHLVI